MPIWRGTTNTDWNTASNWVIDGSGNSGVPTSTTDAIFDSGSTNPCVMGANRVCRDLIFSSFPNTLTVATFTLQVNRNVTLQSDISSRISGTTGTLSMAVFGAGLNGTVTSNGGTWPLNYSTFGQSITITFADPFTCAGNASIASAPTYSGSTFSVNGNFSGGMGINSTTNCIMVGTGTLSLTSGNMELNTAGTITISGNITASRRFIITAVGSLVGLSTANFTFISAASEGIIDLGGRTVQDFATNTSVNTYTIRSSFTCRNISLIAAPYNGPTAPSSATITVTGNYNITINITSTNGTLDIVMTGATGTASVINNASFSLLPVTLNAGANTITYSGAINLNQGCNVTRTSGLINAGSTTTTVPSLVTSVRINNMIFNNLTVTSVVATITANVANTINGTLLCNGNATFSGTAGWTAANFTNTTAGTTITLQSGINYTVTSNLRLLGTNASPILLSSSSPTTRAFLTLNYGASMLSGDGLVSHAVYFVRATRIDSSLGQTIWNTFGSISTPLVDTVNWNPGSRPNPTSYTYIT